MPFSVQEIRPDALICAAYKWLMGPYSMCLSYFGDYFKDGKPIEFSWFNKQNSNKFAELVNYQDNYREGAQRYCIGEVSNFVLIPMMIAALEQILDWGVENIQNYGYQISNQTAQELRNLGCFIEEDDFRAKHLFGVKMAPNMDAEVFKQKIKENQVFVSVRGEYIRVSAHVYNNENDFNKLLQCFKASIKEIQS